MDNLSHVTDLLGKARAGDRAAWAAILDALYPELKKIAHAALRGRPAKTGGQDDLQTTVLVHEAWLRLAERAPPQIRDRKHFFVLASVVMRQIVCDFARERLALKRGGGVDPVALAENLAVLDAEQLLHAQRFVDLDSALAELEQIAPRQVRVVECRFFLGLSDAQTAEALDSSVRTVRRDWADARAWLKLAIAK
jgi:RNA polymerase sigma factor (TIGR02999 family)